MKTFWLKTERSTLFNVIRFFRIRGANERIARGFALGLVVNFFPTFGFGVLISGFFARVFGGNIVAGFVGGSTLTFFWPLLFYLNMLAGSWAQNNRTPIEYPAAVTGQAIDPLAWGSTFVIGAVLNSLLVGLTVYVSLRLLYERTRPAALAYFRHHAREHQRRFSLHHQSCSR